MSDRFKFPDQILAETLTQSAREQGASKSDNPSVFKRALVVAVDVQGGKLQNPGGTGELTHLINNRPVKIKAIEGPLNPRNSIKARIITDGLDQFFDDDSLRIFYPMQESASVKPGEHAIVMFEDSGGENGWWFGRVPGHEGANLALGEKSFSKAGQDSLASKFPDTAGAASPEEDLATDEAAGDSPPGGRLTSLF
jgi:hypothetical protein